MTLDEFAVLIKLKVWLVQHTFYGCEISPCFYNSFRLRVTNNFKYKIRLFDIIFIKLLYILILLEKKMKNVYVLSKG